MKQLLIFIFIASSIIPFHINDAMCQKEEITENKNVNRLEDALARLAKSADLHESLQYKIQCTEDLMRKVHRRKDSAESFGFLPNETMHMRHGILIVRDEHGIPNETRIKLNDNEKVVLNRKGDPKEISLPPEFDPISEVYPFSQIAWFTTENQQHLNFRLLPNKDKQSSRFIIQCPNAEEMAVEFLDRNPPILISKMPEGRCSARASGQLCLDPETGEVSRINFYPLRPAEEGCVWELSHPFAIIEQNVIETSTGAHFPSHVETLVPLSWRDTAVFIQNFEDCVFADVRVIATYDTMKKGE